MATWGFHQFGKVYDAWPRTADGQTVLHPASGYGHPGAPDSKTPKSFY